MQAVFPSWIVIAAAVGTVVVVALVIAAIVASTSGRKDRIDR